MQDKKRKCTACKVSVSADLSFCPLCGKYLLLEDEDRIEPQNSTFPQYDYTYIIRGKWVRTIRNLFINLAIICFFVNLLFPTNPFWFPYPVASLLLCYLIIFEPFKRKSNFLKYLVRIAVCISLFIIFIDMYVSKTLGTTFGWSVAFVAPSVFTGFTVLLGILGLSARKYDVMHFYGALIMVFISIIYFVCRLLFFANTPAWATLMFLLCAIVVVLVLFTFKYTKLIKDLLKRFRI